MLHMVQDQQERKTGLARHEGLSKGASPDDNRGDLWFHSGLTFAVQVLLTDGPCYSRRYIQILWSLEIAETHVGRSHSSAYGKCSSDLTVRWPRFEKLAHFFISKNKVATAA